MYIDIVPNRNSPPAILLREAWREGKKTHKRTLANLSKLPPEAIEALKRVLRGETLVSTEEHFDIERSLPHGAVAVVTGMIKKLGIDQLLASRRSSERDRALAMIAARVLAPTSRLAMARMLDPETATSTLGSVLDVESVTADQLYAAMDWLGDRKEKIEAKLAKRHLSQGTLLLYDVTRLWPPKSRACNVLWRIFLNPPIPCVQPLISQLYLCGIVLSLGYSLMLYHTRFEGLHWSRPVAQINRLRALE